MLFWRQLLVRILGVPASLCLALIINDVDFVDVILHVLEGPLLLLVPLPVLDGLGVCDEEGLLWNGGAIYLSALIYFQCLVLLLVF